MKNLQLLLGVLFFTLSAMADSYPVKFGPTEKGSLYSDIYLLGVNNESAMVFKNTFTKSILIKFNPKLAQELTTEIEYKLNKKNRRYEDVSYFNDKIILFTSYKDKKTKVKKLYYDLFDAKTLKRKSVGTELASYQSNGKLDASKGGSFNIYFSQDKKMMGIIIYLPYDKKAKQKFKAIVFDENFEKVSEHEYTLPVLDSKMSMGMAHLSNDGTFYVAATEYLGEKKIFKPTKVKRHIYKLDIENGLIDNEMKLKNKYIYSYTFKTNEDDNLILSGYYTIEGRSGVVGAFYLRFDAKEGDVVAENSSAFPDEIVPKSTATPSNEKSSKGKSQPGLFNHKLKQLITTDDGGALLVSEQYYTRTRTYRNSNGTTRTITYYYYNDIIVSRLNEDGEFLWSKKIRKRQISSEDGGYYSSFAFHFDKNNIYIMYNDNIKNYDESGKPLTGSRMVPANFKNNKKNVTSIVTINMISGDKKKEQLFNKKETGTIVVPKIHYSDKENDRLYFYTKKGKNERIGYVSFE